MPDGRADVVVVEELGRFLEVPPAALLRADLDDAVRLAGRVAHPDGGFDRVRDRLFAVDILAGRDRVDGHLAVPVIGRADEHRVDVVSVEDAPVLFVALDLGAALPAGQCGHRVVHAHLVHVARGDEHRLGVQLPVSCDGVATSASADEGRPKTVVGANGPGLRGLAATIGLDAPTAAAPSAM